MQRYLERMRYSNDKGTADITLSESSPVSILPSYTVDATFPAIEDLVNKKLAALAGCVVVPFGENAPDAPTRINLYSAAVGADNTGTIEDVYGVESSDLDGNAGIVLHKLCRITNTYAAQAVAGGRTNHNWPKACSVASTGRLLALTGGQVDVRAFPDPAVGGAPCGVCVYDTGQFRWILRALMLAAIGPATGVAPLHSRWR